MIAVQYAIPAYYVHKFEVQIYQDRHVHAHCWGKGKVEMSNGQVGYKYVTCTAELDQPGLVIQFKVNQKTGRIVAYAIA